MGLVTYNIPPATCFTRNPIRYKIGTDINVENPGLFILCSIEYRLPGASTYNPVAGFPLTPDSNGLIEVDVARIADKLVNHYVPTLQLTAQAATGQVAQIRVTFTEFQLSQPLGGTPLVMDPVIIIKGGIAHERWQQNTWFENRYPNAKLLTWLPTTRDQLPWCNDWVTYLHLAANASLAKAVVTVVFTDASTDTFDIALPADTAVQNTIYTIPAGYANLNLAGLDPAKIVHYYTIGIYSDETPLSELVTWYMQYNMPGYETFHLNYFNSLGGYDCMPLTGEHTLAVQREYDLVSRNTSRSNYNGIMVPTMSSMNRVREQTTYKANIGVIADWSLHDLRRELFLSEEIYTRKNNRWWPVSVLDKSADFGPVSAQVKEVPIEWSYAFSNTQYTPEAATLGNPAGFEFTTQCPIVTYLINATEIRVSFVHAPAPVDKYIITLLDADDDPVGASVEKTIPYTAPITHLFTGLTADTVYKVKIVMVNTDTAEERICIYANITTLEVEVEEPEEPGGFSHLVRMADVLGSVCPTAETTVYSSSSILGTGARIFTDPALTLPVSAFLYIALNTGFIYELNDGNEIGTQLMQTC